MSIATFERLLNEIDECCNMCGTRVLGENVKESPKTDLQATAIGICDHQSCMSRLGCREGDLIVVLGISDCFGRVF